MSIAKGAFIKCKLLKKVVIGKNIKNIGKKAILYGAGLNGDKEFYYSDITSVQFKNLGMTTGFLQFEYAGSHSTNNFVNENSFTFSATMGTAKHKKLKEDMPPIYEYVQDRVRAAKESKIILLMCQRRMKY